MRVREVDLEARARRRRRGRCTAPTSKPGLGMLSPTVRTPGTSVGGGSAGRGAAASEQREAASSGGQARSHVELAITWTGVPTETKSKSHFASYCVTRTQPCEAAYGGTSGYWCIAMPPLNGDGPEQPVAERHRPPLRVLRVDAGTSRGSSVSTACRSRRRSRGRPGCPGSRARPGGRSAPRCAGRRGPA